MTHLRTSKRLSININDDTSEALRELASCKQVTITEVVRRAVSVYSYLDGSVRNGHKLQLDDGHKITTLALP